MRARWRVEIARRDYERAPHSRRQRLEEAVAGPAVRKIVRGDGTHVFLGHGRIPRTLTAFQGARVTIEGEPATAVITYVAIAAILLAVVAAMTIIANL